MPGIARVGDLEQGICPVGPSSLEPPLTIETGATTVFANGRSVARTGDPYGGTHVQIPYPHTTHPVFCGAGSGSVFIEGLLVFRMGDSTVCGSTQVEGSGDVRAGG